MICDDILWYDRNHTGLRYFKLNEGNRAQPIEELVGKGRNPFHDIYVGFNAHPCLVDWDGA